MKSDNSLYNKFLIGAIVLLIIVVIVLVLVFGFLKLKYKYLKNKNQNVENRPNISNTEILVNPKNKSQIIAIDIEPDYEKLKQIKIIENDTELCEMKQRINNLNKIILEPNNNKIEKPSLFFDDEIPNINKTLALYSNQETFFWSNNPFENLNNINDFLPNIIQNKQPFSAIVLISDNIKAMDNGEITQEFKNEVDNLYEKLKKIYYKINNEYVNELKNANGFQEINNKLQDMYNSLNNHGIKKNILQKTNDPNITEFITINNAKYQILDNDKYGKILQAQQLIQNLYNQINGKNRGHYFRIHGQYDEAKNEYELFYEDTLTNKEKGNISFYSDLLRKKILNPIRSDAIKITEYFGQSNLHQNGGFECGPFVLYNNNIKYFNKIGIDHQSIIIEAKKHADGSEYFNNRGENEQIYNKQSYNAFCSTLYLTCYLINKQGIIHNQFDKIAEQLKNQIPDENKNQYNEIIKEAYTRISDEIIELNKEFITNNDPNNENFEDNLKIYDTRIFQIYGNAFNALTTNFNGLEKINEINNMRATLNEINSCFKPPSHSTTIVFQQDMRLKNEIKV
jgi:hypothetical protein